MSDPPIMFAGFFALVIVVVPNLLVCGYMLNRGVRQPVIPLSTLCSPVKDARMSINKRPKRTRAPDDENWTGTPLRYRCGQHALCIGQWYIPADMCASCSVNRISSRPHRQAPTIDSMPGVSFDSWWGEITSP